ncbi:hypothetical protein D9M71_463970 [compost metagenome]
MPSTRPSPTTCWRSPTRTTWHRRRRWPWCRCRPILTKVRSVLVSPCPVAACCAPPLAAIRRRPVNFAVPTRSRCGRCRWPRPNTSAIPQPTSGALPPVNRKPAPGCALPCVPAPSCRSTRSTSAACRCTSTAPMNCRFAFMSSCWATPVRCSRASPAATGSSAFLPRPCARAASMTARQPCRWSRRRSRVTACCRNTSLCRSVSCSSSSPS